MEVFQKHIGNTLKVGDQEQQKLSFKTNALYTQTYTRHPFIDIYAAGYSSEIPCTECKGHKTMYLRDSEMTILHLDRLTFQLEYYLMID